MASSQVGTVIESNESVFKLLPLWRGDYLYEININNRMPQLKVGLHIWKLTTVEGWDFMENSGNQYPITIFNLVFTRCIKPHKGSTCGLDFINFNGQKIRLILVHPEPEKECTLSWQKIPNKMDASILAKYGTLDSGSYAGDTGPCWN